MDIRMDVQGIAELRKTINALPEEVEKKVVQVGSLEMARVAVKEARRLVPVKTGRLKASIRVRRGVVRPHGGGRTKGAKMVAGGPDIAYTRIIEFGVTSKGNRFPFIRPALNKHLPEQTTAFGMGVGDAIVKATKAARRKAGL